MATPDVQKARVRPAPPTKNIPKKKAQQCAVPNTGTDATKLPDVPLKPAQHKRSAWNKFEKATFLGALERSCNVAMACRKIGRPERTAYAMRQRDPEFASGWATAIDRGYAHLETRLLQIAMAQIAPLANGDDHNATEQQQPEPDTFDTGLALRLIASYQKKMAHVTAHPPVRMASDAETDSLIIKQLKALHSRLQVQETRKTAAMVSDDMARIAQETLRDGL